MTCSGGDAEFGAGAVDEVADGRLAPPGCEGGVELADVLPWPGKDWTRARMSTDRVKTPEGMAAARWFQASDAFGFFRSRKTSAASADSLAW